MVDTVVEALGELTVEAFQHQTSPLGVAAVTSCLGALSIAATEPDTTTVELGELNQYELSESFHTRAGVKHYRVCYSNVTVIPWLPCGGITLPNQLFSSMACSICSRAVGPLTTRNTRSHPPTQTYTVFCDKCAIPARASERSRFYDDCACCEPPSS